MWFSDAIIGAVFIAADEQLRYIIKGMQNIISEENQLNGWYQFARIVISPYMNKSLYFYCLR